MKTTRISFDGKRLKAGGKSMIRLEDVNGASPVVSGALQLEAKSSFQVYKTATRVHRFVTDTFLNELEDLHELETSSALHRNQNLVLADFPCSIHSAQGQGISAHDAVCSEHPEDAVRIASNVTTSEAQGRNFRSDQVVDQWNSSVL